MNLLIQHFHPLPLQESYRAESANAPMLVMPGNAAFCAAMFSGSREQLLTCLSGMLYVTKRVSQRQIQR